MSDTAISITEGLSQLSVKPRRVGAPRVDPTVRLLHRFYEPLVLLWTLDPTRGAQDYTSALDSGSDDWHIQWSKFLGQLSWICDYKSGGDTVSAVAAQTTPNGPVFWLASNINPALKARPHLEWVLKQLEGASTMSPQELAALEVLITAQCLEISKDKIKFYRKKLLISIQDASKILAERPNQSDSELLEALKALKRVQAQDFELCSMAYNLRDLPPYQTLTRKRAADAKASVWSNLCHYIGRLGSWTKASKLMVQVAKNFPQYICSFEVDHLEPVPPIPAPAADSKTHLSGALRRMFQQHENDRLQRVEKILSNFKLFDVSARFEEKYKEKTFRPRVHAELLLLEHFYHRNLPFVGNHRYIGCSKPSCYCCDLYIKCHPGQFAVRATHGNLWVNWRAPIPPIGNEKQAQKHTQNILNDMIKVIRKDVVFQIESRAPPSPRKQDSTTGITTVVTGLQQRALENSLPLNIRNAPQPFLASESYEDRESGMQSFSARSPSPQYADSNFAKSSIFLSDTDSEISAHDKGPNRSGISLNIQERINAYIRSSPHVLEAAGDASEFSDEEVIVFRGREGTQCYRT